MASRSREPLTAYRIVDARVPPLDGSGAALFGARWNSPGRPAMYAAACYAGAMLEKLAHTNGRMPAPQVAVALLIPGGIELEIVSPEDVPGWNAADQSTSRAYGDAWLAKGRTAVLLVPSAVVRLERNVVLNPAHPDFGHIKAGLPEPVVWDERLFPPLTPG